jgi:hypothetical protein
MNIKTITYHAVHNYGAVLQSYALQKTILSLGASNEIINFNKDANSIFYNIEFKFNKANLARIWHNFVRLIYYPKLKRQYSLFEEFINNELLLTDEYRNYSELISNPPQADCYLVGSDQVWNTYNGCISAFFLEFGSKNTKRVSYAASMGVYDLSEESENKFINYLNAFDNISVREEEAKKFIEEKINKKCSVNIDPVFLLDKDCWSELASQEVIKEKYILCYPLAYNELMNDSLQKLKRLTGYKIVVISANVANHIKGDIYIRDAGPKQFLALFKEAEYILTTSFHGTAFSIIFEKNFFVFSGSLTHTRITNLIKKFNLSNRIAFDIDNITLGNIDYVEVNARKEIERQSSIEYLKTIMRDENE